MELYRNVILSEVVNIKILYQHGIARDINDPKYKVFVGGFSNSKDSFDSLLNEIIDS